MEIHGTSNFFFAAEEENNIEIVLGIRLPGSGAISFIVFKSCKKGILYILIYF